MYQRVRDNLLLMVIISGIVIGQIVYLDYLPQTLEIILKYIIVMQIAIVDVVVVAVKLQDQTLNIVVQMDII